MLLAALLSISGLGRFTHEMRLAASQASVHPSGQAEREAEREGGADDLELQLGN